MKVTLTHDGKSVELDLTAEQMTALGLKEEEKKTGYERVKHGEKCFRGFGDGTVSGTYENGFCTEIYYDVASYYSDEDLAKSNIRADKLMRQLRRFAAENGGIPSVEDWNGTPRKYGIICIFNNEVRLETYAVCSARTFGGIFFNDEKAAEKAIKLYHNELIWYFTEYEAMLR